MCHCKKQNFLKYNECVRSCVTNLSDLAACCSEHICHLQKKKNHLITNSKVESHAKTKNVDPDLASFIITFCLLKNCQSTEIT